MATITTVHMLSPVLSHTPIAESDLLPSPQSSVATPQLLFKKHKVLPHPRRDTSTAPHGPHPMAPARKHDQTAPNVAAWSGALSAYASTASDGQHPATSASPRTLKHQPQTRKMRSGPDLPPTPPAHSRTSSSSYSAQPSSVTSVQSSEVSAEDVQIKPPLPTTPTKQMSPPTPDVTPPSVTVPAGRVKGAPSRGPVRDRDLSKGTSSSQAESFRTAREDPSGDDDGNMDGRSTIRSLTLSARTSESTVRHDSVASTAAGAPAQSATPKPKREPGAPGNDGVRQEWDGTQGRNAVAQKRRQPHRDTNTRRRQEVVEDVTVSPTNAAQAVRSMPLPKRILTFPSPKASPEQPRSYPRQQLPQQPPQQSPQQQLQQQQPLASAAPITAQMTPLSVSGSEHDRRVSTISSKSTASTFIEAYLIDTPPQRRRTLRHVRKQVGLRDSISDMSPISSAPTSVLGEGSKQQLQQPQQLRRPTAQQLDTRQEKAASGITIASVGSRSARCDIIKAGAIPVLVVPSRRSSAKSINNRELLLRSTSSRRSNLSQSAKSIPLSQFSTTKSKEYYPPSVDRTGCRPRAYSDSKGTATRDQWTIDYPPVVPRRTSSLSAPTSRNVSRSVSRSASRSGSLTAESLKAHNDFFQSQAQIKQLDQRLTLAQLSREDGSAKAIVALPRVNVEEASPTESALAAAVAALSAPTMQRSHADLYEGESHPEPKSPGQHGKSLHRHLSPMNAPFSPASVDTATSHHSHAEVSEALAVNIYAHQNTSILVVDHSTRPSDSSDNSQLDRRTNSSGSSGSKVEMAPFGPWPSAALRHEAAAVQRGTAQHAASAASAATPHPLFLLNDVDSPLRNPRAPPVPPAPSPPVPPAPSLPVPPAPSLPVLPAPSLPVPPAPSPPVPPAPSPPAINFIPATPSGMTPATDKEAQRGNLLEKTVDSKHQSGVSRVLNRVIHRKTHSEYIPSASRSKGLIGRTVSLSKLVQRKASLKRTKSLDRGKRVVFDPAPADETRLHPFWRPASFDYGHRRDSDSDSQSSSSGSDEEYYRYPPIDNRPHRPRVSHGFHEPQPPRKSLSARMKRTFAIMPLQDSFDTYPGTSDDAPERRTVRRTPSGNLRVVKHRSSIDLLGRRREKDAQPLAVPQLVQPVQSGQHGKFWKPAVFRTPSLRKKEMEVEEGGAVADGRGHEKHVMFSRIGDRIGDRIGESGLQSIPRCLSERRREKRSEELRRKISAPREVRDGVGEVIRHTKYRDTFTQAQLNGEPTA